jgi:ribosome maturation factor RimP
MGLELVDVETALADGRRVVRVVVDRPWPGPAAGDLGDLGVTIGECAAVARKLSALLDEADGLDGPPYVLEVASPGLDRPLLKEEDFRRFSGRLAKIDLTVDGRKVRRKGRLATAEGPLRLIAPEGEIAFEYAPGLKASLIPEFEDLGQVPPKKGAGGEVDGGPINSVA